MPCTRRHFLQTSATLASAGLTACSSLVSRSSGHHHVVVVGGGFAGATAAKYIRLLDPSIAVTLIDPKTQYITCPGSNWLFAELTQLSDLSLDATQIGQAYGVTRIVDSVSQIDADKRRVQLSDKQWLGYDRLVVAPGIDFKWDALPGYNAAVSQRFPHAWQAGPQTLLLQRQIQAMPAGGVVVMMVPAEPYRCPPGPYERASLIAYWLKQHKPRAKLIILDAKARFSKQALFEAGWKQHFGYGTANSIIEWQPLTDNPLVHFDADRQLLQTDFGDRIHGDVITIIPPQQAGAIARQAGLCDSNGWCPVAPSSSESLLAKAIHVIGDAAHMTPIPKSAFAANAEAKVCARAVVASLNQQPLPTAHWLNTCYSLITPTHGISVAGVYTVNAQHTIEAITGAGGLSPANNATIATTEARFTLAAYQALRADSFS